MRRRSSLRLDFWLYQPHHAPASIVSASGYLARHSPLGPESNICPQYHGFNNFLCAPEPYAAGLHSGDCLPGGGSPRQENTMEA